MRVEKRFPQVVTALRKHPSSSSRFTSDTTWHQASWPESLKVKLNGTKGRPLGLKAAFFHSEYSGFSKFSSCVLVAHWLPPRSFAEDTDKHVHDLSNPRISADGSFLACSGPVASQCPKALSAARQPSRLSAKRRK